MTALLVPVAARSPDVLLGAGRAAGAPTSACARVPVVVIEYGGSVYG